MSDNAPQGEFLIFQAAGDSARVECRFESDTLCLNQVDKDLEQAIKRLPKK